MICGMNLGRRRIDDSEIIVYRSYTVHRIDPYREKDTDTIKNIVRCNRKFHGQTQNDWVVVWGWENLEKASQKGQELYGIHCWISYFLLRSNLYIN